MYKEKQCPKCMFHADHVYTFESDKKGVQWVIERCPNCGYAGFPDNPHRYNDYLTKRRRKELGGSDNYFDDETGSGKR